MFRIFQRVAGAAGGAGKIQAAIGESTRAEAAAGACVSHTHLVFLNVVIGAFDARQESIRQQQQLDAGRGRAG